MRLVRAGVARSEAMGLMGHETESMFVRYAINDLPSLERAVGKLADLDAEKAEVTVFPEPLGTLHTRDSDENSDKSETRACNCLQTRV